MTTTQITRGATVVARTAFGNEVRRRALGGPEMSDFLIVKLVTEEEWNQAKIEGREPSWVPWPAEDVFPIES